MQQRVYIENTNDIFVKALYQCSTKFQNKFLEKLREKKNEILSQQITVFDKDLDIIVHRVDLHERYEDNITYTKVDSIVYQSELDEYSYDLEINNRTEISDIKRFLLAFPSNINHYIVFKTTLDEDVVFKYQEELLNELEKDQILRIKTLLNKEGVVMDIFFFNCLYNRVANNKLRVLWLYQNDENIYKIKIDIDNSDVTNLMKEHFAEDLMKIENVKHRELFCKNFYNGEFIFFSVDSTLEDVSLLQKCKDIPEIIIEDYSKKAIGNIKGLKRKKVNSNDDDKGIKKRRVGRIRQGGNNIGGNKDIEQYESTDITFKEHNEICKKDIDIIIPFILFKTIIDSAYFNSSIIRILNRTEMERCHLFKEILKSLKIDLYFIQDLFKSTKEFPGPAISKINEFYALEIIKKIKALKVSNSIHNYKSLLLFFYQFIEKDSKGVNFFKNIEVLYDIVFRENLEKRIIVEIDNNIHSIFKDFF